MASELFKLVGTIAISTDEAVQNITAVITEGEGLESKLKSLGEKADSHIGSKSGFSAASIWLGNTLSALTTKAVELGSAIWKAGYSFTTDLESWTMTFKTYMNGDMEAAQAFVEELKQFAYDTPLSISDVMSSAAKLMASGIDHDEVIDTLWMLGDLANGNTELMNRIAYAYGQIVAAGKMQGNDPRQLKEAFVPIYKMLEEYYQSEGLDYDLGFLMELQADGEITAEDVHNAFKKATGPEGQWYNAMNNQMDTTAGKMEKLNDAYTMASASLIQSFTEIMKAETLEKLTASFDKFVEWAEENPDVLDGLAQALSNLATAGLEVLLGSLQDLLTFWNTNQDLFNGMLMLLGGVAIKSGKYGAGMALITAGGYNVWDDWVKEQQKEFSGLSSDVDLPFIKQQMEYQGFGDQWEAYLENWKSARKGEGYTDADIDSFVENQFANYQALTNEELRKMFGGESQVGGKSWLDWLFPGFSWVYDQFNKTDEGGETSGSLNRLRENMHNLDQLFASANGMPDRDGDSGDASFTNRHSTLSALYGGMGGAVSIAGLIASVQGLTAAVQSMTGEIPSAISAGVGNISVTGTVTTGDVTLDTGAIVGQIAPKMNLVLGGLNAMSSRG